MILFVTGTTGFIGGRFLARLLDRLAADDRVYALERRPVAPSDPRVITLAGDLREIGRHAAALGEARWVFHLAADATFGKGEHYAEVNLEPVQRMVEILKSSTRLERFVFVSTIGVLDRTPNDRIERPLSPDSAPNPTSDYGRSKLAAEQHLRASGLPFTILRPGWVYGARMRARSHLNVLAASVARRPWVASLAFPGRVPLIHVDDLSSALVRCLDAPASLGRTYLAVSENRSLGEILAQLHMALYGRPVRLRFPCPRFQFLLGRLHGRLPLAVSNLFINYLEAADPAFRRDLLPTNPVLLERGVQELAAQHAPNSGHWLVTGANSGIGLALVHQLLKQGCPVIAVDRHTFRLAPARNLEIYTADLTDAAAITRLAAGVRGHRLAYLINNAGVGFRGGLLDQEWWQAEQMVQVNIVGTLRLTYLLKEQLLREGTTIVNIASSVAYHPLPGMSVYAASKSFLQSWSLALGEELRATNRVVTFSPSGTRTNFQRAGGVKGADDPNLLDPAGVATAIVAAAHAGNRHVMLGAKSRLMVFVSYFVPARLKLRLWSRLFAATR